MTGESAPLLWSDPKNRHPAGSMKVESGLLIEKQGLIRLPL